MSVRRLPRELGVVIRCNADGCGAKHQTANVRIKVNRRAASSAGWIKGGVTGMRRFDYCPEHAPAHLELIEQRKREREERRKKRDAERKEAAARKEAANS